MKRDGLGLITLLIMILVLSIIIAVFSSLMTTKHFSSYLPVHSKKAFYLANAGIEYGIRYVYKRWHNFVLNPEGVIPNPPDYLEKEFYGGKFQISYDKSKDTLISKGSYKVSERVLKLHHFSGYASPSGSLSEIPSGPFPHKGKFPAEDRYSLYIPLLKNVDKDLYVFRLDLAIVGPYKRYLKEIWFDKKLVWRYGPHPPGPFSFVFKRISLDGSSSFKMGFLEKKLKTQEEVQLWPPIPPPWPPQDKGLPISNDPGNPTKITFWKDYRVNTEKVTNRLKFYSKKMNGNYYVYYHYSFNSIHTPQHESRLNFPIPFQ